MGDKQPPGFRQALVVKRPFNNICGDDGLTMGYAIIMYLGN